MPIMAHEARPTPSYDRETSYASRRSQRLRTAGCSKWLEPWVGTSRPGSNHATVTTSLNCRPASASPSTATRTSPTRSKPCASALPPSRTLPTTLRSDTSIPSPLGPAAHTSSCASTAPSLVPRPEGAIPHSGDATGRTRCICSVYRCRPVSSTSLNLFASRTSPSTATITSLACTNP